MNNIFQHIGAYENGVHEDWLSMDKCKMWVEYNHHKGINDAPLTNEEE